MFIPAQKTGPSLASTKHVNNRSLLHCHVAHSLAAMTAYASDAAMRLPGRYPRHCYCVCTIHCGPFMALVSKLVADGSQNTLFYSSASVRLSSFCRYVVITARQPSSPTFSAAAAMATLPAEPNPGPCNKESLEEASLAPIRRLLARANTQINRFTAFIGLRKPPSAPQGYVQAEHVADIAGTEPSRQISEESATSLASSGESILGPEVQNAIRLSLRIGAGILAAVVVLRVGSRKNRNKGKPKEKRAKARVAVKPGVRMAEDISRKAHAAGASVEQAVAGACHSVTRATAEVKGTAMKVSNGTKTVAGKTKSACVQTKDACLKATSDAKDAAAEAVAICDAAVEGMSPISGLAPAATHTHPPPAPSAGTVPVAHVASTRF